MKQTAVIAGVGMTRFGKHLGRNLKSLAGEAIQQAMRDAGLAAPDLQAAWMANAAASVITGQICIPGQIVLREMGIGKIPVINVENACASASTAFNQASNMISAGAYDVVLACGYEKLYHEDKQKTFSVFTGSVDVENLDNIKKAVRKRMSAVHPNAKLEGSGTDRSLFMDIYAAAALTHMKRFGTTREQFAMVSVKNSFQGSLNPRAQFQESLTLEQVLEAREITWPLTLPMCSPIGDGAAAVVLVSRKKAREMAIGKPVKVLASVLAGGWDYAERESEHVTEFCARQAYAAAGIAPADLHCAEVHDACAAAEVELYEALGFCPRGEGGRFVEMGHSRLGGKLPVNTSGGLLRKGHPIGATGIAQLVELTEQLQGRAGRRQVDNARLAMAENGGGFIGSDVAAACVSILGR
ncbi:MAG: thiolase family protein [Gammaproteobacteria bacterium]|nr:thiolase family protein [Gammaproteobacteria bacterium]